MLSLLLIPVVFGRILEHRDPKVDPLSLDDVVSKIVDSTMNDLRFRLRQAIYALALRQTGEGGREIDKYEDWLLQEFLSQVKKQQEQESSHTMSIALETHTVDPSMVQKENKIVTASDLRMMDSVEHQPNLLSSGPIPIWILLLLIGIFSTTLILFAICFCIHLRRRKTRVRFPRIPDPFTISAVPQGPGAFLDRLRETERDAESLFTLAPSMESIRAI